MATANAAYEGEAVEVRAVARDWLIAAGILGALLTMMMVLYWDTATAAVSVWIGSRTYNHCFLIIPISAYLIWERRHVFATTSPAPFPPALALFPAFGLGWLLADTASILEVQQFALMGMMQAAFLSVLGWQAYRALLFPLLYLVFLVPSGEFLVPYLQDFAAAFAVGGLRLLDIPVYSDGIFVMIPNGRFEVAEACAGLRFMIASIAFGFLFANLIYRSLWRRTVFVALSFVVPVIANGFRVVGIILLAHFSNNKIAVGADHLIYGWGFFTFVLLILIVIGLRFREDEQPTPRAAPKGTIRRTHPVAFVGTAVVVAVLSGMAPSYAAYVRSIEAPMNAEALQSPDVSPPWRMVADAGSDWQPTYGSADARLRQAYANGGQTVELFVAFYARQRPDAEVVAHENRLTDGEVWQRAGDGRTTILLDGREVGVATTKLLHGDRQRLVVHWNWIGGEPTASRIESKILQAKGELLTGQRAAAKVGLSLEYSGTRDAALETVRDLLRHIEPIGPMLADAATR